MIGKRPSPPPPPPSSLSVIKMQASIIKEAYEKIKWQDIFIKRQTELIDKLLTIIKRP